MHVGNSGPTIQFNGDNVPLANVMQALDVVRYSLRVIRVVRALRALRSVYAVSTACCEPLSREVEPHART